MFNARIDGYTADYITICDGCGAGHVGEGLCYFCDRAVFASTQMDAEDLPLHMADRLEPLLDALEAGSIGGEVLA